MALDDEGCERLYDDVSDLDAAISFLGAEGEMADAMRDLRRLGYGEQVAAFERMAELDDLRDLTDTTDCLAPISGSDSLDEVKGRLGAEGLDWRREMTAGLAGDCADIRRRLDRVLAARAEVFSDFDYPPQAARDISTIKGCVEWIEDGPLKAVENACSD